MNIIYWLKPWEYSRFISIINIIIIIIIVLKPVKIKNLKKIIIIIIVINLIIHSRIDFFSQHILFINITQHLILSNFIPIILNLNFYNNNNFKILFLLKRLKISKNYNLNILLILIKIIWVTPIIHFFFMINKITYITSNKLKLILNTIFWANIIEKFKFKIKKNLIIIILNIIPELIIGYYIFFINKEIYTTYNICGDLLNKFTLINKQQISGLIIIISIPMIIITTILIKLNFR